jgi:hypothetical protein
MANPPVRGLRQSIPSGTVLGRTEGGFGPARAITLAEITNHVITTGKVISSGGAIPQQWEAGSVNSLATGLSLSAGTLISNYQAPPLAAIGAGLSLSAGTLTSDYQASPLTTIGAGLSITTGTLISNYQAPVLATIGAGLSITTGTLISNYQAPVLATIGAGLSLTGGTLASNYQASPLTTIGAGLSITTGTIAVGTLAYSNLPASADIRTLSFNMTGTLPGKQAYSMIMTQPGTLLANGGVFESYIPTKPTATNTLVINTIHGTTVTPQATIAISVSGSISGVTFAAVPMAAGDVIQFVNQATADTTFADPVFAMQYQVS